MRRPSRLPEAPSTCTSEPRCLEEVTQWVARTHHRTVDWEAHLAPREHGSGGERVGPASRTHHDVGVGLMKGA